MPRAQPHREIPALLVQRIAQQADGNPFYVEELVNFIRYNSIDPYDEHALAKLQLPASLQSLVLSRMDQLNERQKTTLKVASVVGRTFRASWLRGIYPDLGGPTAVHEDLVQLTEQGFTADDPAEADKSYVFKHVITHSVVYESLLHRMRIALHEEIGQYVERTYGDRLHQFLDLLAYHFDHSANEAKRRKYLRWAGEAAQAAYANEAAIDYYRRVLPLLSPPEQVTIMLKLGEVEQLVGHWDQAVALFQEARLIARALGDLVSAAWCETAAGEVFSNRGAFAEATQWLALAEAGFRALDDRKGLGICCTTAGRWRPGRAIMIPRGNATSRAWRSAARSTMSQRSPAC